MIFVGANFVGANFVGANFVGANGIRPLTADICRGEWHSPSYFMLFA